MRLQILDPHHEVEIFRRGACDHGLAALGGRAGFFALETRRLLGVEGGRLSRCGGAAGGLGLGGLPCGPRRRVFCLTDEVAVVVSLRGGLREALAARVELAVEDAGMLTRALDLAAVGVALRFRAREARLYRLGLGLGFGVGIG